MATIRDVAKLAGVSISTVSRVMNTPQIVSEATIHEVEQAIAELGYSPNALARGLIQKETHTVGVLIPDISNNFASELVKGLEDEAHKFGISLILCNTNRDRSRMIHYLNVLRQKQVDGIVFTSETYEADYAEIVRQMKIPIVLAATECLINTLPTVKINDQAAAFTAVEYLVSQGHSNIGMLSGPKADLIAGLPRYLGFREAYAQLLGSFDLTNRVEFADFFYESGYQAMEKLYKKNPLITAVFCVSDEVALGAISYLHDQGLKVPQDVSILGFDNTKLAQMSIPKLTTVAQPIYEIGRVAMKKLQKLKEKENSEELVTFMAHEIVERESVRSIKD